VILLQNLGRCTDIPRSLEILESRTDASCLCRDLLLAAFRMFRHFATVFSFRGT
jgi:hypothetical protein